MDAAVGPFGVAGVVVCGCAKLRVASRHAGGQPDDSSSIGRGRLRRVAAARITRVADVGSEGFHLRDAERLAQAVGEFRRSEIGVGVEGPVAPLTGRRVVDEPGAKVESVCVGEDVRDLRATTGLGAEDEIRFARAEERADAGVLYRPPVLGEIDRAEAVVPGLLEVHLHSRGALLKIGKDAAMDRPRAVVAREGGARRMEHARRKGALGRLVVVRCQRELTDIVATGTPPRRLAGALHRRQEQADERADDGDHDEQLDEGKAGTNVVRALGHSGRRSKWRAGRTSRTPPFAGRLGERVRDDGAVSAPRRPNAHFGVRDVHPDPRGTSHAILAHTTMDGDSFTAR